MPNSQISVLAASATALIPSSSAPCTAVLSNVGSYDVYLGGGDASTSSGWKLGAGRVQTVKLGPGHSLYGRADGTDSTVNVVFLPGGMEVKPPGGTVFSGVAVYTPEKYGAVRDGSTDDRAAIQAAIDAAYTAGGGIVQLREGNYRVQPTVGGIALLLKTGVRLQGAGMGVTTVSTDNTASAAAYCLIAPFGYNTATSPYSAHEIDIRDLTLTGTSYSTAGAAANLHNLIGFCHCPWGLAEGVGFNITAAHYAEFNLCKNVTLRDCATVGDGNHGLAKFQLDAGGTCGQRSSNAYVTTTLSSVATRASGTQTLLTVPSTAGFKADDLVVITGANGTSAASYNAVSGYRITEIVSGTTMAINLAFPPNTSPTTAGAIKAITPVNGVLITGYQDKAGTDTSFDNARHFFELSHTDRLGRFLNVTLRESVIVPVTFSGTIPAGRSIIGFDNGAYPHEVTNLKILDNQFVDGGHTGVTTLINLHLPYDANYPAARVTGVEVSGNVVRRCGMKNFLVAGDAPNETTFRTTIATTATQTHSNILVERNRIYPVLRGSAVSAARPSRIIRFGGAESASVIFNKVIFPNLAPDILGGTWPAWTNSVSANYAFMFDHVRNLKCEDNEVEVHLTTGNANLNLQAFCFSCAAFEVSQVTGFHSWKNNIVTGVGSIGTNLAHSFIECQITGAFITSWTSPSPKRYFCNGIWSGNRGSTGGTAFADAWSTLAPHYNTPTDGITGSDTTVTEAATWGRHDWFDGQDVIQEFSNAAVTVDPLTTTLLQTGAMSASRIATLPPAIVGRPLKVLDQNGSVTGANTIVLTRAGADTINGVTTLTLNAAYASTTLIPNRAATWTQLL